MENNEHLFIHSCRIVLLRVIVDTAQSFYSERLRIKSISVVRRHLETIWNPTEVPI